MAIKAVIFDLYGTLVSVKIKTNPYKMLFDIASSNKDDKVLRFVLSKIFLKTNSKESDIISMSNEVHSAFVSKLKVETDSTKAYPEALAVLTKLKQLGYLVGMISNSSTPYKEPFYRLGLDKFVDCDIFSCDVGYIKPNKTIYELARERLAVDFRQIIMVGDSLKCDVLGPKAVGMKSILLDRNNLSNQEEKIKNLDEIFKII